MKFFLIPQPFWGDLLRKVSQFHAYSHWHWCLAYYCWCLFSCCQWVYFKILFSWHLRWYCILWLSLYFRNLRMLCHLWLGISIHVSPKYSYCQSKLTVFRTSTASPCSYLHAFFFVLRLRTFTFVSLIQKGVSILRIWKFAVEKEIKKFIIKTFIILVVLICISLSLSLSYQFGWIRPKSILFLG